MQLTVAPGIGASQPLDPRRQWWTHAPARPETRMDCAAAVHTRPSTQSESSEQRVHGPLGVLASGPPVPSPAPVSVWVFAVASDVDDASGGGTDASGRDASEASCPDASGGAEPAPAEPPEPASLPPEETAIKSPEPSSAAIRPPVPWSSGAVSLKKSGESFAPPQEVSTKEANVSARARVGFCFTARRGL